MQIDFLRNKTNDILKYLSKVPYADETVRYYGCCYESILRYCESDDVEQFDHRTAEMYSAYQREKADRGETSIVYTLTLRKAAFVLADYLSSGIIDWKRRNYDENRLPNSYQELLDGFTSSISGGLAPGSVELLTQMVRRFLFFLEESGYHDVCDLTDTEPIRDFIIRETPKHSGNRVNLTWPIKKFMRFLLDAGKVSFDASPVFMNPVPNRKKILPCFEDEEINALFGAVDTTSAMGKRDLAIMKLALSTGIRSIDLRSLKLDDIDWHRNEIRIIQDKTDTAVSCPLLADAGNALADYILNARPKSDSPYVFLRVRRPYTKLAASANGANILKRYREKTELEHAVGDGKTFHAFRRTAGTNLIRSGATLEMTSQILGHNHLDSSRRYLSLHDEMLAECCMALDELQTRKEGLA